VAAQLKQDVNVETDLIVGTSGEFTVWVGDKRVAEKTRRGFPDPDDVVDAVRDASR
jgi:predicted Rdx family selenoprotein